MRHLCRGPDDQLIVRHLERGNGSARFHRIRSEALIDESFFDDDVRLLECFFGVSGFKSGAECDVVREFVIKAWAGAFHRFLGIHHGGQRLVIDFNQIRSVTRDIPVGRDNRGDRLSDKSDFAHGQQLFLGSFQIRHFAGRRNRAAVGRDLVTGDNGDDAGKPLRFRRVDAFDPRVSVDAACDGHVEHARKNDVVHIRRGAGDKPRIFFSLHGLTDIRLRHG